MRRRGFDDSGLLEIQEFSAVSRQVEYISQRGKRKLYIYIYNLFPLFLERERDQMGTKGEEKREMQRWRPM